MVDQIWPNISTGPDEIEQRGELEQRDADSILNEQREQERISGETGGVFDKNRVTPPGAGDGAGGRVRVNRDHWGE